MAQVASLRVSRWVRFVPIAAAFLVGAASFTLSFFAQRDVATQLGAVPGALAWLVPVVIDGGILAGSASLWSSSTRGTRKDPVAYLTIVSLLALSVVINVRHASDGGGVLGQVIAGAPPVVLLLTLELVAVQARREARDAALAAQEALAAADVADALPLVSAPAEPEVPDPAASFPVVDAVDVPAPGRVLAGGFGPAWEPALAAGPPVVEFSGGVAAASGSVARVSSPAPAGASIAEQVRALFAEHVASGGDPMEPSLARTFAELLDARLSSVRKVISQERAALTA